MTLYQYDLETDGEALAVSGDLRTAVIVSLLTDARADAADPVPDATDLRGWWGDSFPDVPGDKLGSKLWLCQNMPATQETLDLAQTYCEEALQWMIDDGIVESVAVTLEIQDAPSGPGKIMAIRVQIKEPGTLAPAWIDVWNVTLST